MPNAVPIELDPSFSGRITPIVMNMLDTGRSATKNGSKEGVLMAKLADAGPGAAGLDFVQADSHLLLIEKPAGLLSVPGRGADKSDCVAARAQRLYPDALVVHRLDMATSGLLLMARGASMQRRLSQAFADREVGKRYVAVVAGRPEPPPPGEWALIDLPLAADWPNRPRRIVDREAGKPSQTRWRCLSHDAGTDTSRLELEPITGRSHQLRVHLQALGHPILGDAFYAPPEVRDRAPRLLLHASRLRLSHPATGEPLICRSEPPF
jgi:tRNA pseudouridine32 synthase / 23S rRNA pseudouridine746 synthase